jgi:hypothetical protein
MATVRYNSIDCDKCKYKAQCLSMSIRVFNCIMQTNY